MPFHCMHGISLSHVEPKESQLKSRNRKGEAVKSFEETCSFYEQQHCLKVKVWSEKEENVFLKMPLQHKDAFPPIVHICASKRLLLGVGRCCCPYSVHSIRVPNTHNGWMFFLKPPLWVTFISLHTVKRSVSWLKPLPGWIVLWICSCESCRSETHQNRGSWMHSGPPLLTEELSLGLITWTGRVFTGALLHSCPSVWFSQLSAGVSFNHDSCSPM